MKMPVREEDKNFLLDIFYEFGRNEEELKKNFGTIGDILKLMELKGYKKSHSSLRRLLETLDILKSEEKGYYQLNDEEVKINDERVLRKELNDYAKEKTKLKTNIKIAILKTKINYNRILAEKLKKHFSDEIVFTHFPDDSMIVVYYRYSKNSNFINSVKRILEEKKEIM